MGPDTFTITGKSEFGSDQAKTAALKKANAFAANKGLHMIPVNVNTAWEQDFLGDHIATYELIFHLVSEDDPEYARANLRAAPDVIIEHSTSTTTELDADRYAKLRDLKQLLDEGVLTQTEFDQEKARILAGKR